MAVVAFGATHRRFHQNAENQRGDDPRSNERGYTVGIAAKNRRGPIRRYVRKLVAWPTATATHLLHCEKPRWNSPLAFAVTFYFRPVK